MQNKGGTTEACLSSFATKGFFAFNKLIMNSEHVYEFNIWRDIDG